MLSALLYKKCHTETLADIIIQLEKENRGVTSLLWKILLVYSRFQHSEQGVCEMRGANLLQGHDSRDFRIRWLTVLVMRSALLEN